MPTIIIITWRMNYFSEYKNVEHWLGYKLIAF